jgi:hypothetical protein
MGEGGYVRAVVLGAVVMAVLAGCGAQSRVYDLKSLTPSEAKNLVASFNPRACNTRGRVLVRYSSPVVHGKGSDAWWCVEPANAYRVVSRDLRCPAGTRLKIDFERHVATCDHSLSSN